MTTSPEVQSELEEASRLIQVYRAKFSSCGYDLEEEHVDAHQRLTADSAVFTFRNAPARRRLMVAYYPPHARYMRSFVVSLKNDSGKSFLLDDYLDRHGKQALKAMFLAPDHNADVHEFWARAMTGLADLILRDPDLKKIAQGEEWEDVPFDWQDFK